MKVRTNQFDVMFESYKSLKTHVIIDIAKLITSMMFDDSLVVELRNALNRVITDVKYPGTYNYNAKDDFDKCLNDIIAQYPLNIAIIVVSNCLKMNRTMPMDKLFHLSAFRQHIFEGMRDQKVFLVVYMAIGEPRAYQAAVNVYRTVELRPCAVFDPIQYRAVESRPCAVFDPTHKLYDSKNNYTICDVKQMTNGRAPRLIEAIEEFNINYKLYDPKRGHTVEEIGQIMNVDTHGLMEAVKAFDK